MRLVFAGTGVNIYHMSNKIDEQKLKEAKEKLACHIEPPKPKTEDKPKSEVLSCAGSPVGQADFIDENGKVLLTQMTSAGG